MGAPPEPKSPTSARSRVTSNRQLYYIVHRMLKHIASDVMTAVTEEGSISKTLAGHILVEVGGRIQEKAENFTWPDWSTDEMPPGPDGKPRKASFGRRAIAGAWKAVRRINREAKLESHDTRGLGTSRLVRADQASQFIGETAYSMLSKYESRFRTVGTWRAWATLKATRLIVARHQAFALSFLTAALYKQTRKIAGMQNSHTRNWKATPDEYGNEKGTKHGYLAWKRHTGRPALSESEWRRRYELRLEARRKKAKTKRRAKRGPDVPNLPDTKWKRPDKGSGRPLGTTDPPVRVHDKRPVKTEHTFDSEAFKVVSRESRGTGIGLHPDFKSHFEEWIDELGATGIIPF